MSSLHPLISCICITRGRPHLLHMAIGCFIAQDYINKELVIVYESTDTQTCNYIGSLPHTPTIKYIKVEPTIEIKLGALRNMAIERAAGEYICQWDDDDWYHSQRLTYQYNAIIESGLPACVLTELLMFDNTSGEAYISMRRLWEGSLLCRKDVLQQIPYYNKARGEDSVVIEYLRAKNLLHTISAPYLYSYNYHGANTWDYTHWKRFLKTGKPLGTEVSNCMVNILQQNYTVAEASALLVQIIPLKR